MLHYLGRVLEIAGIAVLAVTALLGLGSWWLNRQQRAQSPTGLAAAIKTEEDDLYGHGG